MQRSSVRTYATVALLVLAAASGAFLWHQHEREVVLPQPPVAYGTTTPLTSPSRLVIPAIGVDANVQHVGITKTGNMAVPDNYTDVGWYRLGSAPGDQGNAVIAGHLDTGFGRPAVFIDLEKLKPGDEVVVQDASGEAARFIVERLQIYDYNDAPMEEIFGPSDESRLNLITCDGVWNPNSKTYNKRLVVFTKAAPSQADQPDRQNAIL